MTAATPIGTARALTDLDKAGFRVVAVRARASEKSDLWSYTLPDREIAAFKTAIDDGTIVAVTARLGNGTLLLLAKVSRSVRS